MINRIKNGVKKQPFLMKIASVFGIGSGKIHKYSKTIKGQNNKLIVDHTANVNACEFHIIGDSNVIEVSTSVIMNKVTFYIRGNHNTINIDKYVKFKRGGSIWIEDDFCKIDIGQKTTFEDVHLAATENNSEIQIGKDCMFAYDIDVRTGDSHAIIDRNTNKKINAAKNIVIGDHVWVASHVSILKGVTLPSNSVVATRSVVTKSFEEEHTILAGIPAVRIKSNINWDRRRDIG